MDEDEGQEIKERCTRHKDAQHSKGECNDTPNGPSFFGGEDSFLEMEYEDRYIAQEDY